MPDPLTPEARSWNMSRIRSGNTKPELALRSLLHKAGYRFTVHGPLNRTQPPDPPAKRLIPSPRENSS